MFKILSIIAAVCIVGTQAIAVKDNGYGQGGRWAHTEGGKPTDPHARGWGQGGRTDK